LTTTAPLNIEDVLVDGIELAGRLELGPWLRLSANYTRLWTRVEGGGELPGRARSEATIRLEASPESQLWKIASEWHHVSQIPLTLASSGGSFVAARATWDASVSLDLARLFGSLAGEQGAAPRSLRLGLVGTNLGDISVQDARGLPQPGRSLTLEIEARW
jgi:outer membrane receptor protein involved in Fe transport